MLTNCLCRENLELFLGSRQKLFVDPCCRDSLFSDSRDLMIILWF